MPRRTDTDPDQSARQAAHEEMVARIRLLIRNPQFLKDLRDLRKLDDPFGVNGTDGSPTLLQKALKTVEDFNPKELLGPLQFQFPEITNKPIDSCWEFLRKWDIAWIPSQLFIHPSEPLRGSDSQNSTVDGTDIES
jgi:hypothetical protein